MHYLEVLVLSRGKRFNVVHIGSHAVYELTDKQLASAHGEKMQLGDCL